jgi:CheY-like chemotaxis protein
VENTKLLLLSRQHAHTIQEPLSRILSMAYLADVLPPQEVIFLYLNRLVLDGWEFLKRMKETAKTNRVIILTSSTSELDRSRCSEFNNVLAYHTKPLTQDIVNAVLQAFQAESSGSRIICYGSDDQRKSSDP